MSVLGRDPGSAESGGRSLIAGRLGAWREDRGVGVPRGGWVTRLVRGRRWTTSAEWVLSDGCFWHRCPEHATEPKANSHYWAPKLLANVERDRRVDKALRSEGWTVIRVWEHEDPAEAAARVAAVIRSCSPRWPWAGRPPRCLLAEGGDTALGGVRLGIQPTPDTVRMTDRSLCKSPRLAAAALR
jgi:hypothetical protein